MRLRMRFHAPHRHTLLAITLLASGGIFGSDYPLSSAQAGTLKLPEQTADNPAAAVSPFAVVTAQPSQNANMVAKHETLLVRYGITHDKTVMGLSNVEGMSLLGDNMPLIYRTGGYIGRSLMDKGGSLSRTSDLVEDFRLTLTSRTPTGYGLSISYKLTNPSHDPKGKVEKGVLLGQYLEQTLYVPSCSIPNGCKSHVRLGNTGADLWFDIQNLSDKSAGPSTAATP